ncbi:MAG TPA: aminoacyl-tRNA hydrolase [Candidatus Saccharimonadales bacterium]
MSWLQQRPQVSNPAMFYTVGLNKTVLIVGLGNPGKKYELTRHNIGFECVDNFVNSFSELDKWTNKKDLKALVASGTIGDKRVIVIKPETFMNDSGEAVSLVSNFYKVEGGNILVIHDELDIDFGSIRTRLGGSSAGHNGIKSITKLLGDENYERIRIGIGPKKPEAIDSKDYVLQRFNEDEQAQLKNLEKETTAIITEYLYGSGEMVSETRSFLA